MTKCNAHVRPRLSRNLHNNTVIKDRKSGRLTTRSVVIHGAKQTALRNARFGYWQKTTAGASGRDVKSSSTAWTRQETVVFEKTIIVRKITYILYLNILYIIVILLLSLTIFFIHFSNNSLLKIE